MVPFAFCAITNIVDRPALKRPILICSVEGPVLPSPIQYAGALLTRDPSLHLRIEGSRPLSRARHWRPNRQESRETTEAAMGLQDGRDRKPGLGSVQAASSGTPTIVIHGPRDAPPIPSRCRGLQPLLAMRGKRYRDHGATRDAKAASVSEASHSQKPFVHDVHSSWCRRLACRGRCG